MLTLYTYFRSSAAFRVRIGLQLKGLDFEAVPIHLLKDGGQQHQASYRARNPVGLVPMLEDGPVALTQSLAILEYLDERHPEPPLLPGDAAQRAQIRSLALSIACDIHPLNNLRVLQYLKGPLGQTDAAKDAWMQHWIAVGFQALEQDLAQHSGRYCRGDAPTLADCVLVPQVFNAQRIQVSLAPYPHIQRIHDQCMTLPAFQRAAPGAQPDAE